jgi:hypothetical protein
MEYEIVLDDRPPVIEPPGTAKILDLKVGQSKVAISFDVVERGESGVLPDAIQWGTALSGDQLARPEPELIFKLSEPQVRPKSRSSFRGELPARLTAAATPQPVSIFVQARDRAGNVSKAVEVCQIMVSALPRAANIPKGSK